MASTLGDHGPTLGDWGPLLGSDPDTPTVTVHYFDSTLDGTIRDGSGS